jgi:hypothetical protein
VVGRQGQGEESGVGQPGAGGQASGIWGRSVGAEVGDGVEGGGAERGGAEVG